MSDPIGSSVVEHQHAVSILDETRPHLFVFVSLLWLIMRRAVDENAHRPLGVVEVRARVALWNPELRVVGLPKVVLSQHIEEPSLKLRVALRVEPMPRLPDRWWGFGSCDRR
jgi:hypothetical protein